jgi:uncharacterized repeat protein (TIGR01451 family)
MEIHVHDEEVRMALLHRSAGQAVCLLLFALLALTAGSARHVGAAPALAASAPGKTLAGAEALHFLVESGLYETVRAAANGQVASAPLAEPTKLTALDGAANDEFGLAVAIDGDVAVVGARYATVEGKLKQGAAYVFVRNGDLWPQQALLTTDGEAGDEFGSAVAIDGDTILVGASGVNAREGAVYVFVRNGNLWPQQNPRLTSSNSSDREWFGTSVALAGNTAIIGASRGAVGTPRPGVAYVFVYDGVAWTQEDRLTPGGGLAANRFGSAVAIDGDTVVVGAPLTRVGDTAAQGAAYIFVRSGATWFPQDPLIAADGVLSDTFGIAVAVSGDTALIGAFGADVGGKEDRGTAYVFVRDGVNDETWSQQARLIANGGAGEDFFGAAVALNGDRAIVGARKVNVAGKANQGAAYVFMRSGATWMQRARLVAGDGAATDEFGVAVAFAGDTALVGAYQADIVDQVDQGAAYIFPIEAVPPDLTLTISSAPTDLVLPGQEIVYTLTYSNTGGVDATGVFITELAPAHTRFNANHGDAGNVWSCPHESGPDTSCIALIGAVPVGAAGSITFAVTVDQTVPASVTQIINRARIADDGAHGADLSASNNDSFAYTPVAATPLVVNKSVTPVQALPGLTVTYTIVISATENAATFTLTDTLPPGLTDVRLVSGAATIQPGPPLQIHAHGSVPARGAVRLVYQATLDAAIVSGAVLYNETIVASNGEHYAGSAVVTVPRRDPVHTLMLIYVNADNNLAPHAIELFQKAEAGARNPAMVTLLLLDGRDENDAAFYLLQPDPNLDENCPTVANPTCSGRYIDNVTRWRWGEATSTATSLKEFVTQAILAYPAEQILLALVGHGGGWSPDLLPGQPSFHDEKPSLDPLGGLLWDQNPNSSLSTRDLGLALRASKAETGRQIDLLYLDACLMAMSEVAYEIHDSVDYLLASENWSWTSFRYDKHLVVNDTLDIAQIGGIWIENEADELHGDGTTRVNYPFTYSLLDLRSMNLLLEKENALVTVLKQSLSNAAGSKTLLQNAFAHTECFDSNQDYVINTDDYYCDLFNFAQQLTNQFQGDPAIVQAALEVQEVIQDLIVQAKDHNNGRPWRHPEQLWEWEELGGLSIYLPLGKDDWKRTYYNEAHLRSTAEGLWDDFLEAYWASSAPPAPGACSPDCLIVGPEPIVFTPTPVDPQSGGQITVSLGDGVAVNAFFPAGAVSTPVTVTIAPGNNPPPADGYRLRGTVFELHAYDQNYTPVLQFAQNFTLTIQVSETNASDIRTNEVSLQYWDEQAQRWTKIATAVSNASQTLTASFPRPAIFAVLETTLDRRVYLPIIEH